jgi:hypothetical protein
MNELATRDGGQGHGNGLAPAQSRSGPVAARGVAPGAEMTLQDVWFLAEQVAASGLFAGADTPQKAFTLMMICQSENLHPVQAMKRYHVIEGRPSKRADAIQAEFQADGGVIEILRSDAEEARALFSHPVHHPRPFEYAVTYRQFADSGLVMGKYGVKDNWKKNPADMLWARLVTKAIRKIHPGIVVGIYSTEEVQDSVAAESAPILLPPARDATASLAGVPVECAVIGYTGIGPDSRPYHQVATNAAEEASRLLAERAPGSAPLAALDVHKHLMNRAIQLGHVEGPSPAKQREALAALNALYRQRRDWVRAEIMALVEGRLRAAEEAAAQADEEGPAEAPEEAEAPAGREPGQDG